MRRAVRRIDDDCGEYGSDGTGNTREQGETTHQRTQIVGRQGDGGKDSFEGRERPKVAPATKT